MHRNTFVNFIIGFAEKSQDARTAQKEVEDLKHYFETKGKEYGTLTTENEKDNLMEENLIPNQKDIENYERDKEQFKEGKAPERAPIKEPELDDDEGMGLH